jgi:protein SOK2
VQYYPPLTTEPHLSPEMSGSPGQPSTPARSTYGAPNVNVPRTVDGGSTPRTTSTPQQWVQNSSGYSTPPRANSANGSAIRQPPARGAYQLANGDPIADHGEQTGTSVQDANYAVQSGLSGVPMPSQTPPQSFGGINGTGAATPSSNKRMREIDDDDEQGSRPSSRGHDGDADPVGGGMKRRKTIREGSTPSTGMGTSSFDRNSDGRLNRTRSAVVPGRVSGRRGA